MTKRGHSDPIEQAERPNKTSRKLNLFLKDICEAGKAKIAIEHGATQIKVVIDTDKLTVWLRHQRNCTLYLTHYYNEITTFLQKGDPPSRIDVITTSSDPFLGNGSLDTPLEQDFNLFGGETLVSSDFANG
ncbi:hypothetical protein AVEN_236382-1 [Araneus ventricosus]|uniref:Uncharacterized protein n=1 Tax=Araneus ventricosus TaxID=182803 RepID=A0A4Y2S1R7_ARAVE|nr:hypothetical protein AVEN_236382-1 [Araneus ventricosus]